THTHTHTYTHTHTHTLTHTQTHTHTIPVGHEFGYCTESSKGSQTQRAGGLATHILLQFVSICPPPSLYPSLSLSPFLYPTASLPLSLSPSLSPRGGSIINSTQICAVLP